MGAIGRRPPPADARLRVESVRLEAYDESIPAGGALDSLAVEVFSGSLGRARLAPLFERFEHEVGKIAEDDPDFEQLQLVRMDWALCDATIPGGVLGDTWAWRVIQGDIECSTNAGRQIPSWSAAARSICGLFEVFPGQPTWVRDRLSGLVLRLFDSIGPWPHALPEQPAALWELRLVPDYTGGFHMARAPIDYPPELLQLLEREFPKQFASQRWPALQELRKARLRYRRAGGRTSIDRFLRFRR
jgi:hypothetical protein